MHVRDETMTKKDSLFVSDTELAKRYDSCSKELSLFALRKLATLLGLAVYIPR